MPFSLGETMEINWFWVWLSIGSVLLLMLIEEVLNRKGYYPDLMPAYGVLGAFFIFAFIG